MTLLDHLKKLGFTQTDSEGCYDLRNVRVCIWSYGTHETELIKFMPTKSKLMDWKAAFSRSAPLPVILAAITTAIEDDKQ